MTKCDGNQGCIKLTLTSISNLPLLKLYKPLMGTLTMKHFKAWFLVAGLIVGRTAGKLSCEDCTRIGNLVSDEIIRPENIQAEVTNY